MTVVDYVTDDIRDGNYVREENKQTKINPKQSQQQQNVLINLTTLFS